MNLQRESTSLHDLNDKLEQELRHKEAHLKVCMMLFLMYIIFNFAITFFQLQEEKTRATHEKLELCEQKLAQFATLPEIEQELKQRMEALTQVRAQVRDSFNRSNFFSILLFLFFSPNLLSNSYYLLV